ncbi:unnamed protein product [Calicophoron daubneyi]|uniref:CSC1/OSCA1-like 7TM region domain-containing protein n=1 Tax=Calicophoron daubneyi TaxID=300641 RepID=A0AAV2T9D3_CALDB
MDSNKNLTVHLRENGSSPQFWDANFSKCGAYVERSSLGSSYLSTFQGIPFNLLINLTAVVLCLLGFTLMNWLTELMKKKGSFLPSLLRERNKMEPKLTLRRFFQMPDWEFAQRAGLDAVAYTWALGYSAMQMLSVLPFLMFAMPFYYKGKNVASPFDRLSITNLGLRDTYIAWFLWTLLSLSSLFYLCWTVLRFVQAYKWPKYHEICRSWNDDTHVQKYPETGDESELRPVAPVPCQCGQVNQLPNVLMLSDVQGQTEAELRSTLEEYFASFQPPVSVSWIQPLYDVRNLIELEKTREQLEAFIKLANAQWSRTKIEPEYHLSLSGCSCSCKFWCPCLATRLNSDSAIDVYENSLVLVNRELESLYSKFGFRTPDGKERSISAPMTGVVFVGLRSPHEALQLATEFSIYLQRTVPIDYTIHPLTQTGNMCCSRWTGLLESSHRSRVYRRAPFGHLQLAPPPASLLWTNLMRSRYRSSLWWVEQLLKTIVLFFLALLLTSPTYLLYAMNFLPSVLWVNTGFGFIAYRWIPSLVLVSAAALVKQLVIASEAWEMHGTYGGQEKVGQRSLFAFLLITVLLFPSLGITGLPILFMRLQSTKDQPFRLECIFTPDSAALFVNYIITCALFGSGLHLLQIGRWFYFLTRRLFCVHSDAEAEYLAQENAGPFPFRERYASMALIQTITMAYTPLCPVILPFGLLYMFCDFLVCKYAFLRIYSPKWYEDGHETTSKDQYKGSERIYHMTWFIQSTYASLTGICLACLNLCFFFGLRVTVVQTHNVTLAFAVLTALVIFSCLLLSSFAPGRWGQLSNCGRRNVSHVDCSLEQRPAYERLEKLAEEAGMEQIIDMKPSAPCFSQTVFLPPYLRI